MQKHSDLKQDAEVSENKSEDSVEIIKNWNMVGVKGEKKDRSPKCTIWLDTAVVQGPKDTKFKHGAILMLFFVSTCILTVENYGSVDSWEGSGQ